MLPVPGNAAKTVATSVGPVDIAPTILQAVALPVPLQWWRLLLRLTKSDQTRGTNQANDSNEIRPIYAESATVSFLWLSKLQAWRTGKYLYVAAPERELIPIRGCGGAHNLAATSKAVWTQSPLRWKTFIAGPKRMLRQKSTEPEQRESLHASATGSDAGNPDMPMQAG